MGGIPAYALHDEEQDQQQAWYLPAHFYKVKECISALSNFRHLHKITKNTMYLQKGYIFLGPFSTRKFEDGLIPYTRNIIIAPK